MMGKRMIVCAALKLVHKEPIGMPGPKLGKVTSDAE